MRHYGLQSIHARQTSGRLIRLRRMHSIRHARSSLPRFPARLPSPYSSSRSTPLFVRMIGILALLVLGLTAVVFVSIGLLANHNLGVIPQDGLTPTAGKVAEAAPSATAGAVGSIRSTPSTTAPISSASTPKPGTASAAPITVLTTPSIPPATPTPTQPPIYWGAYIGGSTYDPTWGDAPWDAQTLAAFEAHAGKAVSIIQFGQAWQAESGSMHAFDAVPFNLTRAHGAIPLINWNPWQSCCGVDQPTWRLANLINGRYDAYITRWAEDARAWGHPFFLRIMDEMNGNWYPWSEGVNGNLPGQFVQAWRHIHDLFTAAGATNVAWVWNPNTEYNQSLPLEGLYPGDDYVDWVAMTGFNFGPTHRGDAWLSFATLFGPIYDHLGRVAPSKPVMIGETASTENGGSKADWITDALATQIPNNFPRVKALVWFNWTAEGHDWFIESSPDAQNAFLCGITSPYYAANDFSNLDRAP